MMSPLFAALNDKLKYLPNTKKTGILANIGNIIDFAIFLNIKNVLDKEFSLINS